MGATAPAQYFQGATTQAVPSSLERYVLEVDWNNNGNFNDTGDDLSSYVFQVETQRGRDRASTLTAKAVAGRLDAILDNRDGRFSPFNTGSPLTGSVLPGRPVRFRMASPYAKTLWTGYLETIEPIAAPMPTAILSAFGPIKKLTSTKVEPLPRPQSGETTPLTGQVVGYILDDAGWNGGRSLDNGDFTVSNWFVTSDRDALNAIRELEETELGFFYEGLDFTLVFERHSARTVGGPGSFSFVDDGSTNLAYLSLTEEDVLSEIYNSFSVTVQGYTEQAVAVLWTMPDVPFNLAAGATITYFAQYPNAASSLDAGYVRSWTTPVVGTDITQTGVSNSDISVYVVKRSTSMLISIKNNHSTTTASITLLQARGAAMLKNQAYGVNSSDATSQSKYGLREYPGLTTTWYSDGVQAQIATDYNLAAYKDPRAQLTMSFPASAHAAMLQAAAEIDISDPISAKATGLLTELGINGNFWVESIGHFWQAGGILQTTLGLSPQ